MDRVKDKIVIITGASYGQGAAEAYLFAKEGAKVIATTGRSLDKLAAVVDKINADFGEGTAVGMKLDVASEDDWKKVVDDTVEKFGTIDILVNNAGVGSKGLHYDNTTKEDFDSIMNTNAWGPFVGMKTVVPVMIKAGKGSVVNVSSLAAVVGVDFNSYCMSKGGVVSLTRGAAQALGKYNIRVNTIIPGTIVTPMTEIITEKPAVLKACEAKTAIGHLGDPDDIAYGVLYFASDEAKYVTGADLTIDGGERFKDSLDLTL